VQIAPRAGFERKSDMLHRRPGIDASSIASRRAQEASSEEMKKDWTWVATTSGPANRARGRRRHTKSGSAAARDRKA
jgi:hypothetical protein